MRGRQRSLDELGVVDVAVCGLAKRMEEVWLPGDTDPVILPRTSEALYLLQRVRDEAHRFAITYHRQKRSSSMLVSLLDDVPGLGETRRKALMEQFGSLKRLRAATVEEFMAVPGIGRRTAEAVQAAIARAGRPRDRAATPATGGGRRRRPGAGRAWSPRPAPGPPPRSAGWRRERTALRHDAVDAPVDAAGRSGPDDVDGDAGGTARGRRRHRALRRGKAQRGRVLEDLGWFVVDNLPPALLLPMVELGAARGPRRFAAVVDVRSRAFSSDLAEAIQALAEPATGPGWCTSTPATRCWSAATSPYRREHPLQGTAG